MSTTSSDDVSKDSMLEDMMLLLECIKYQKDSLSSQKQALATMGTMCSRGSDKCKELFRTGGCLEYVIQLVKNTESMELVQTGLCTLSCAAEKNVSTQMRLSERDIFTLLNVILKSSGTPLLLKSSATLLIISVINSNSKGQRMAEETKLLHKLIDLFKTCIPLSKPENNILIDYWSNIARCLSSACDNPQNELNQNHCCSTLPVAVGLLQSAVTRTDQPLSVLLLRPAITIITSCVANNSRAQDRLHMVGGLRALTLLLNMLLQQTKEDIHLSLAIYTIQALFAVASSNVTNIEYLASFQIVPLLLHFIDTEEDLSTYEQLSIIACLETLIESNDLHQQQFIEGEGETILIGIMGESMDESVSKTIPIIIRHCKRRRMVAIQEREEEREENLPPDCLTDVTTGNCVDVFRELGNKKVPLTTKISDWLEKAEAQSSHTDKQSVMKALVNECQVENTNVIATSSTTIQSRLDELENSLVQERDKRLIIEQELQEIKKTTNEEKLFKKPSRPNYRRTQKGPSTTYQHIATPRPSSREAAYKIKETISQSLQEPVHVVGTITSTPKPPPPPPPPPPLPPPPSSQTHSQMHLPSSHSHHPSSNSLQPPVHQPIISYMSTPRRPKSISRVNLFQNKDIKTRKGTSNRERSRERSISLSTPNVSGMSLTCESNGVCPGCQRTPLNQPLTSRTFLPCLSLSNDVCRYHRRVAESILTRKELIHELNHHDNLETFQPSHDIQQGVSSSPDSSHEEPQTINTYESPSPPPLPSPIQTENAINTPLVTTKRPLISSSISTTKRPLISSSISTTKCPLISSSTTKRPLISTTERPLISSSSTTKRPLISTTERPLISSSSTTKHQFISTTERPLISTTNHPLQLMTLSPVDPNVERPLQNIINRQQRQPSLRVYDYRSPFVKKSKSTITSSHTRQKSLYFKQEEVEFLLKGVEKMGTRWKHILRAYSFQTGRTASSLKDKYRLLIKQHSK